MNDLTVKDEGKPLLVLANKFDAMIDRFENILPPHVTPQRFKQVVMTAVAAAPDLMTVAATNGGQHSIIMSSLKCASDGLLPDGREAALVPFNCKVSKKGEPDRWEKRAQYMPMVKGIVTKMQQSPDCKEIRVNLVHANDKFHYAETNGETEFRHEPMLFGDRGDVVGAYAFMRTADGGFYFAPVSRDELEKIEASSKAGNSPWKGPFKSEMQKKSALKRLEKIAPVSREVRAIIDHDNEAFHDLDAIPEKPKMLERLRKAQAVTSDVQPEPEPDDPEAAPEPTESAAETVLEGEVISAPPSVPVGALPILEDRVSAAQAVEYAKGWAALYKSFDKAARDHFWSQTEDDVDRIGKISSKAMDICSEALNSPAADE